MSEKEIIKIIQDYIATTEWLGFDHVAGEGITEEDYEAIKGLLDLYKKQQKEIEELENKIAKRQWVKVKENGEVEPLFYISKDKINDKIKEYQNKLFQDVEENKVVEYENIIQVLEDLLEEE